LNPKSVSILLALLVAGWSVEALALKCAGGIVSLGEIKAEVHMKCGEPTLWDQRIEETTVTTRKGHVFQNTRTVDEWTYDFGPNRLVQILFFHDGKLVKIKSGGYGQGLSGPASNRIGIISVGDRKSKVLRKWGEPAYEDQRQEQRTFYGSRGETIQKTFTIDEWVYDFGPKRYIRILTFEDGRLVSNRTGDHGTRDGGDEPRP
jgi:hypothetical protein